MRQIELRPDKERRAPQASAPTPGLLDTPFAVSKHARNRYRRRHPWRRIPRALAAGLLGALFFTIATRFGVGTREWQPIEMDLDRLAARLGLGLDQVSLVGHRFTTDSDVFSALDLVNVRSQLGLDSRAARQRIERLPWVETAQIFRELPDGLTIAIRERMAAAVWRRDGRDQLIDDTGRVLGPIPLGSRPDLLRVEGEGAEKALPDLLSLLARHETVARRVESVERVGARRWTLHLAGGVTVLLPATDVERAMARLDTTMVGPLLAANGALVDMRLPEQLTVGSGGIAAATAFGAKLN